MWLSERDPRDQRNSPTPISSSSRRSAREAVAAIGEEDDLREAEELPDCDVSDDGLASDRGVITSRDDDFAGIAVAFVAGIAVAFVAAIGVSFAAAIAVSFVAGIAVAFVAGIAVAFVAGIAVAFVAAIADRRHWDRDTWKFPGGPPWVLLRPMGRYFEYRIYTR